MFGRGSNRATLWLGSEFFPAVIPCVSIALVDDFCCVQGGILEDFAYFLG